MTRRWRIAIIQSLWAASFLGCGGGRAAEEPIEGTTAGAERTAEQAELESGKAEANEAEAKLESAPGVELEGKADFLPAADGVLAVVEVENATPGMHGIHIHEKGDCSDIRGKSMGKHYAPEGHPHALPDEPDRHLGDMGNIEVSQAGEGRLEFMVPKASLEPGRNSILGKALVIHEKEDIGTGESGESGDPIACGIIRSKED